MCVICGGSAIGNRRVYYIKNHAKTVSVDISLYVGLAYCQVLNIR